MSEKSTRSSCPHLGLGDDRGIYCLFPDAFHRCYRCGAAKAIPWDLQELFCLREGYVDCPVYRGLVVAEPKSRRRLGYVVGSFGLLLIPLVLLAQVSGALGGAGLPASSSVATSGAATALTTEMAGEPGV